MVMQGMSLASLKRHPSLLPLFFFLGLGVSFATVYTLRLAVRNPDVSWNKKTNPEPWQEYSNKQYKFYSPTIDYNNLKDERPKF